MIALTPGEPAGIGPDLAVRLAARLAIEPADYRLALIADPALLQARAAALGVRFLVAANSDAHAPVFMVPVALADACEAGVLNRANAPYVLACLRRAVAGCSSGEFAALVTGPVHKGVINDAGIPFTGHTEWLAAAAGVERVVMMLVGGDLRVALATIHLPLAAVSAAITRELVHTTLEILHRDLITRFGIAAPCIAVCGLNPHAGESGYLGREELDTIAPALAALRAEGMNLRGPLPADTAFTPRALAGVDAVLAMYHDQGLPVLKHHSFGHAVNVTLGLPFIRTSVDHGTALELAGTGDVDPGSLDAALALALTLVRARAA